MTPAQRITEIDELNWPSFSGVYFLVFGDRVKIGCASNIRRRALSLRWMMPQEPTLAMWIETERNGERKAEQQQHAKWSAHHEHGEWFRVEGALLATILFWNEWLRQEIAEKAA